MKKFAAVFLFALWAAACWAGSVSVRVFSMRDITEATVVSPGGGSLKISAENGKILINGKEAGARHVCFGGKYDEYKIKAAGETRAYRGSVKVSAENNRLAVVVDSTEEDYTAAVLPWEYDVPEYMEEAAKAIAVIVRTYAAENMNRHGKYSLCDSSHCQQYRSGGRGGEKWESAAKATAGKVLAWGDKKKRAFFSACCGGLLDSAESVWSGKNGTVVPDNAGGKDFCAWHKYYSWTKKAGKNEIESVLDAMGIKAGAGEIRITGRTPAGRARELEFCGGRGCVRVDAEKFFSAFGKKYNWARVPSKLFKIEKKGDTYFFYGKGQGHGAGLCVAGATEMARQGYSYEGILKHYFPDADIAQR